jgi:hypothetical protein
MQENTTTGVPAANEGNMSFIQRVINVFVNPGTVFKAVREKPRWIAPAVLVLLLSLLLTWYITPVIEKEQQEKMVTQLEKRGMDQEKIDEAIQKSQTWMKYVMYPSALIGTLLMILAMAGIWLFVAKTLLGGQAAYAHMLEVVSLSMLIPTIGALIKAPIMMHKMTMNVHFSLATFLPDSARETFLYKVLMNTDFFNIWFIAVLCIGIATVAGLKVKKSWPVVAGLLVLWYLVTAGISSMMG